jgi:hypothetical protein
MRRVIKTFPVFFIFLATLVFYAHMIIPHDHHPLESDSSQEEKCPASDNGSGNHTRFPLHCHAFNELTSEKAVVCVIIRSIKSLDFGSDIMLNTNRFYFQLFTTIVSDGFIHPLNSGIPDLSYLRAPPMYI